jgi:hypothetical protein
VHFGALIRYNFNFQTSLLFSGAKLLQTEQCQTKLSEKMFASFCRSRGALSNEPLVTAVGGDTAENAPSRVRAVCERSRRGYQLDSSRMVDASAVSLEMGLLRWFFLFARANVCVSAVARAAVASGELSPTVGDGRP